jgi:8-oxo-dGTP pyrophosphatase MutT (NUDIX family)
MMRPEDDDATWVVHGERPVYESRWVTVGLADITQPSGERFEHHTVTLPAASMAVVLDGAWEHVLLSWRHRFVPDVWGWELPAGLIEEGEQPAEAALREIEEETGYRPSSIDHLVTFEPMVGTVRSPHHVFLVRGASKVGEASELNEGLFEWVALSDLPELIGSGKVVSSGSLIGLLYLLAFVSQSAESRAK